MVLLLLPDKTQRERERERGWEGGTRATKGVLYKKEGCYTQKDKVLGLGGSERECLGF